ncbi:MAG TPA: efflux RND transporter periplasmic adaptor subunit [Gemmataceae bacterium]|nr:efflux RND transporter periplasmic adaptor subunit [Gemmataceae bacterium]
MRRSFPFQPSLSRWMLAFVLMAVGCTAPPPAAPPAEPPMVTVAPPVEKPVVDNVPYNGRTEAIESVEIRARVTGYLSEINFKAGSEVKAGDLLFVIDERPYKAILANAEGQIKLAEAKHKFDVAEVNRNAPLVKSGATTQSEFDKMVASRDQSAAAIEAEKAASESARLNLGFCRITAPVAGRISRNLITAGNLVVADSTLLTSIVSQDPMYVLFDVDEPTLLRVQQLIREGKFKSARQSDKVPVNIGLTNEGDQYPHPAVVDFVDNKVDPSTGTLKVRAVVPNPIVANGDRLFSSGMFVRVQVPLGEPRQQLLVTERAISSDQGQKFLYVVAKQDGKSVVEYRPVAAGPSEKGGLRVVYPVKLMRTKEGLRMARPDETAKAEDSISPGDLVIVDGIQRARPGLEVRITETPMPMRLPLLEAKQVEATKPGA